MDIGSVDVGNIAVVLGVILFSMTIHEAMHGFVAHWLGDDTAKMHGRLTLNPLKHIDPFLTIILPLILALTPGAPIFGGAKPVPFNPAKVKYDEWGAAMVAIAGPLTNLLIAFIAFGVWSLVSTDGSTISGHILQATVLINLGFFVFNMIPIPPLDGSRVLYALAPEFVRRGMEAIEQYGVIFVFVIVLLASSVITIFMQEAIAVILSIFQHIFAFQ